jgi:hypothetical protein
MNTEALFIFLILLLGLILCSFLGNQNQIIYESYTNQGNVSYDASVNALKSKYDASINAMQTNYDNYNHYNQSSTTLPNGTAFTGKNGGTIVSKTNSNGKISLIVTLSQGEKSMTFNTYNSNYSSTTPTTEGYTNYYYGNELDAMKFYGPNGNTATLVIGSNGTAIINVKTSTGTYIFTQDNSGYYDNVTTPTNTQYYGSTGNQYPPEGVVYYGSNGGTAAATTGQNGNTVYYVQTPAGNTASGVVNPNYNSGQYYGPYGGSAGAVTGPNGNTAYYAQGPSGNAVAGVDYSSDSDSDSDPNTDYSSSLPTGIPYSQIPSGQKDMYILKSQVVPPVCPVCPVSNSAYSKKEKCPPCPACKRCPEPSMTCKAVPNYNAIDQGDLPNPALSSFSSFGL